MKGTKVQSDKVRFEADNQKRCCFLFALLLCSVQAKDFADAGVKEACRKCLNAKPASFKCECALNERGIQILNRWCEITGRG